MHNLYSTAAWADARDAALRRDARRCTVSRWLGGACTGTLHVHHIHAVNEGGPAFDLDNLGTACAAHHVLWEALRRQIVRGLLAAGQPPRRCPHRHVSRAAREQCERQHARLIAA